MTSNLKAAKFYFEKLFMDNWTDSPIHFVGQEFDSTGIPSWINPHFIPRSGTLAALSGKRTRLDAALDVVCWASNDVEALDLTDKVIDFVATQAKDFSVTKFEINDNGWDNSNMVYVLLTFKLKYYAGDCVASTPTIRRYVINQGIDVYNNAVQTVN